MFTSKDNAVASMGGARRLALCLAGSVAAASLAFGLAGSPALADDATTSAESDGTTITATSESITLAEEVAQKCIPSVGTVTAAINSNGTQGIAMGSCVVLDTDGDIITNYHVIEGATKISVNINDVDYDAEVLGSDPTSDIAVLKIDPGDDTLTPMEIGDSDSLEVGEWVMTIGAPLEQNHSVSQGIVSGLNRTAAVDLDTTTAYYPGLIQTDAMINSGSSGGALVNADGELVGITTINYSTSGDFAGMSAAIPSNYAVEIANDIIENGSHAHPFLGVSLSDITPYNYQATGSDSTYFGAYVASVVEGGAADEAGIEEGDIITAVDGTDVYDSESVIIAIRGHEIGDEVTLTVDRDGESQDITVTLGSDQDEIATTSDSDDSAAEDEDASDEQSSGKNSIFSIFGGDDSSNGQNSGDNSDSSGSGWGWGYGGIGNSGTWGYWSSPYGSGTFGYGPGDGYGYNSGIGNYGYGDSGIGSIFGYSGSQA